MDAKPFLALEHPRAVGRDDLPSELKRYYERSEGVGLESDCDRDIRLCKLCEVREVAWRDVPIFGGGNEPGWEEFRGLFLAISSFHDGIYWVRGAPCCPAGSILAFGPDVAGPGGTGDYPLEPSLVLAANFDEWLHHLEQSNWTEYGLFPGAIAELPDVEQTQLRSYYRFLNPSIRLEFA